MDKRALLALALIAAWGCTTPSSGEASARDAKANPARAKLAIVSDELKEGQPIPAAHACTDKEHLGNSPALAWSGVPEGTQSIAITAIDPDARGFVHWAVVGMPATATSIASGASPGGGMPAGASELSNDFGKPGYGGPCPPSGSTHHYVFTVYALKRPVQASGKADKAFLQSLEDSALAAGTITVTHKRE